MIKKRGLRRRDCGHKKKRTLKETAVAEKRGPGKRKAAMTEKRRKPERPGIAAVILAAGNSTRFGENKLLYPVEGKPMYRHVTEKLYHLYETGKLGRLLLVTQYEKVMEEAAQRFPEIRLVENLEPGLGISHSIWLALQELSREGEKYPACLFVVGDQPWLREESIERILDKYKTEDCGIVAARCGDRMGNPALFSEKYFDELRSLSGDRGGKKVILRHVEELCLVEVSERELEDIDVKAKI